MYPCSICNCDSSGGIAGRSAPSARGPLKPLEASIPPVQRVIGLPGVQPRPLASPPTCLVLIGRVPSVVRRTSRAIFKPDSARMAELLPTRSRRSSRVREGELEPPSKRSRATATITAPLLPSSRRQESAAQRRRGCAGAPAAASSGAAASIPRVRLVMRSRRRCPRRT